MDVYSIQNGVIANEAPHLAGASCAFGVFDGVHAGHRFIIGQAVTDAHERGASSAVITFDVDPTEVFTPHVHDKLMTNELRLSALAETGVDQVVVIRFNDELAALSPEQFLDELFVNGAPAALFVGEDFRFGTHAAGTVDTLEHWGAEHGMTVHGVPLFQFDGAPVTATRIRGLVGEGNVEQAAKLLGKPYALTGQVVQGRHVGREMGICTANIQPSELAMLPADGVYAGRAFVDGVPYQAAVSVGVPVTFEDATQATIEAHLLDFDGDIYDKPLTLEFASYLRPMQKFASPDALITQINEDISRTREIV